MSETTIITCLSAGRRMAVGLLAVALVLVGCGLPTGDVGPDAAVEAGGSGGDPGETGTPQPTTPQAANDNTATSPEAGPEEVALGAIVDPADEDDPDGTTPDTAPQSQSQRTRADIRRPLEAGDYQLAEQRATQALERTDLKPEFRQEVEAWRDLARAAQRDDAVAAGDAIVRLEQIDPELVEGIVVGGVVLRAPPIEVEAEAELAAHEVEAEEEAGEKTEAETEKAAEVAAVDIATVEKALLAGDWKLADHLAGQILMDDSLTADDQTRVWTYRDLAKAQLSGDDTAVARAAESLTALNPDLVRQLDIHPARITVDPAMTADG